MTEEVIVLPDISCSHCRIDLINSQVELAEENKENAEAPECREDSDLRVHAKLSLALAFFLSLHANGSPYFFPGKRASYCIPPHKLADHTRLYDY